MGTYTHDPQAKLDYGFDWGDDWLRDGETLVTSTWSIPTGLTKVSDAFEATGATVVWITASDAVLGEDFKITNHVKSSAGREDDRSHTIKVRNR